MRPLGARSILTPTKWIPNPITSTKSADANGRLSTQILLSHIPAARASFSLSWSPSNSLLLSRRSLVHQNTFSRTSSVHVRHISPGSVLAEQAQEQRNTKREDFSAQSDTRKFSDSGSQTEDDVAGAQTEKKKSEHDKTGGEGSEKGKEGGENQKDEREDGPPPPPHGDKTPWQVFTETLQKEFHASKEWNDSTKQLGGSIHDFTQNPHVQKAGEISEAARAKTAEALKATGRVVGQGAAWTWDTMPVKGVRAAARVTGTGIEYATRPVRQTKAFQAVKETIDDGSSSRYGGWVEKEERRKRRELRELNELQRTGNKCAEGLEERPDAGTNITLHKDARYKEVWREWKDNSKLAQGFFSMRSAYNESDNPLISTARSISDRISGFFAENETAMVIKKFREMDPNFQMEPFLTEMREYILPEVLDAYVKGDIDVLKQWLSTAQYSVYAALMQQYKNAGLVSDGKIVDIRGVDVLNARLLEPGEIPVFILTCRTQEVHVYRNAKSGDLASGMDDKVQQVTYAIGVTRIPEDVNNAETRGWRLIELQKSARDYY